MWIFIGIKVLFLLLLAWKLEFDSRDRFSSVKWTQRILFPAILAWFPLVLHYHPNFTCINNSCWQQCKPMQNYTKIKFFSSVIPVLLTLVLVLARPELQKKKIWFLCNSAWVYTVASTNYWYSWNSGDTAEQGGIKQELQEIKYVVFILHWKIDHANQIQDFQARRSKNKTSIPTKIHMLSSEFCNSDDFLELNLWTFDMDLRTNHDTSVIHLKL